MFREFPTEARGSGVVHCRTIPPTDYEGKNSLIKGTLCDMDLPVASSPTTGFFQPSLHDGRSRLAGEDGVSGDINVGGDGLFAGKPAPTGIVSTVMSRNASSVDRYRQRRRQQALIQQAQALLEQLIAALSVAQLRQQSRQLRAGFRIALHAQAAFQIVPGLAP